MYAKIQLHRTCLNGVNELAKTGAATSSFPTSAIFRTRQVPPNRERGAPWHSGGEAEHEIHMGSATTWPPLRGFPGRTCAKGFWSMWVMPKSGGPVPFCWKGGGIPFWLPSKPT